MLSPRRLNRACSPPRLLVAAFVSALILLYLATVYENDLSWRRARSSTSETETDEERHALGGLEDVWRQQQGKLEKQQMQAQVGAPESSIEVIVPTEPTPNVTPAVAEKTMTTPLSSSMSTATSSAVETVPAMPAAHTQKTGQIQEDAHRIDNPDAFKTHFDAVMNLPHITYQDAKDACTWKDMSKMNFQFADGEGAIHLNTSWTLRPWPQEELDEQRVEWQNFIKKDLIPWKEHSHKFSGRGIVIIGGSGHSIKRIKVMLKKLARLNSKLPIELHYWDDELNAEKKKALTNLWPLLYFNDLSSAENVFATSYDRGFGRGVHYNLKTAALINSRFAEPLMMDSDNIPIIAPESLWESDVYKEYGTIFWPDIARTRPNNPVWSITNTPCRMDEYEQESGQLLVDKRKFWYHLQLAAWMNAPRTDADGGNYKESYYYSILLGDKDTFRFAWHALKTKYGKPSKTLSSVGFVADKPNTITGVVEKFYCGHSFLQYHPDGRPQFMHGGLLKTVQKPVMKWLRDSQGGIFQAYKKSEFESQHDKSYRVILGWDGMEYLPNKAQYDLGPAWCTWFPDIEPRPLEELVPGFNSEFDELGGYWLLQEERNTEW